MYCVNKLGLDESKVNPRGGAMYVPSLETVKHEEETDIAASAIGHPLGCTGTRQVVTALSELRRQNKRVAVTSMCVGTVSVPPIHLHSMAVHAFAVFVSDEPDTDVEQGMGMAGIFVSEH